MAVKTYEPKAGSEGVVIESFVTAQEVEQKDGTVELDRKPGEAFVVDAWPYATEHPGEQAFLDQHPLVQEAKVKEQPKSQTKTAGAAITEGGE